MSASVSPFVSAMFYPIDLRLADLLERRAAGPHARLTAATGALLSWLRRQGHCCVQLDEWAGRRVRLGDAAVEFPDAAAWRDALRASGLAGDGRAAAPLVLDADGRAYLYRFWRAERRLAQRIRARLLAPPEEEDFDALAPYFRKWFPSDASDEPDWQGVAAAACLRRRFAVVAGGPGSGKTFTAARILALLLRRHPDARIALAAPTGKAAAKLAETVADAADSLETEGALAGRLPREAQTLHRLLGYRPGADRFAYDAERPLALDLLLIDEASMADLLLMDAVFDALPPHARIILLGDSAQLASVGAGNVLGELCRAAGAGPYSKALADAYGRLSGARLEAEGASHPLRDAVIELVKNWRFKDQPGVAELAAALRCGDGARARKALDSPECPDVSWVHPDAASASETRFAHLLDHFESVVRADSPQEALARLACARILCASRRETWGVEGMNRAVEALLRRRGVLMETGDYYRGRPLLILENDYAVRLFNGDIGVCWDDENGMAAWFPDPDRGLRRVALSKLPPHETAWAMTVHKSQGSEFDHVLLSLPTQPSPLLTRELLYTGVTRARRTVRILADADLFVAAAARSAVRRSGLGAALAHGD